LQSATLAEHDQAVIRQDSNGVPADRFNRLGIEVSPSPYSNDHQARIIVDGADWIDSIWPGDLGLDPPHLASELAKPDGRQDLRRFTWGGPVGGERLVAGRQGPHRVVRSMTASGRYRRLKNGRAAW